jgi:rod shape-determining protein MreC
VVTSKTRKLTRSILFFLFLLAAAIIVPFTRPALFILIKQPLLVVKLCMREIEGLVFYHRNFIQNDKLKKEVGLLSQKLLMQQECFLENERLTKALGLKNELPYKVLIAKVMARSPDSWSSHVVVDKGLRQGVKRGMPVGTYAGLVGRVIDVAATSSRVMLINDPNFRVSAIVQRSRQEGLVSGTLGSYLIMRYLSDDADIQAGDLVITSGLSSFYPKGLFIGTIRETGKEFSGLSRFALIKPSVALSDIEEVYIILP